MKKLLWLCLALLFSGSMMAQELVVKAFEQNTRDLTAKTHPVKDLNGDYCALIRVQVAAKDCLFRGNIVGEPQAEWGEYKVYMAAGSRNLYISHPDFIFTPLNYEFPEKILSGHTYSLRLEVPVYTNYSELAAQQIATQEKIYKVGDYYNENGKEGVVFWVDETGKHGKIVSMTESSSQWSSNDTEQRRLIGADSETDGAKNMAVVKQIPDWQSKYPAFKWCADLGEGWYLPAKEELISIYKVHFSVNKTLEDRDVESLSYCYWSSTETNYLYGDVFCVWQVIMSFGRTIYYHKDYDGGCVRAVSAF